MDGKEYYKLLQKHIEKTRHCPNWDNLGESVQDEYDEIASRFIVHKEIVTNRPNHLTESEVTTELYTCSLLRPISDACAITIASWWQSPGSVGCVFAQLASTGKCDSHALLEDIRKTQRDLRVFSTFDSLCFNALTQWVYNKIN